MRRQRDDAEPRLVEVELVEEPGPLADLAADHDRRFGSAAREPTAAGPSARRPERWRQGGRLRVLGISVVASLIVVTVGVNIVLSQREAARRVELAQHPWILPALDGPPQEVWQAEVPGLIAESEGVLVTAEPTGAGEVRALDTGTGEVLWTWAGDEPREPCAGVHGSSGTPNATADLDPDHLVCVPLGNYFRDHRPPEPGTTVTITVLDPVSGAVVARPEIDGSPLTWDPVDGDLLVTFVTHDAAVGIARWDLGGRGQLWTHASAPGVMPQGLFGRWEHSVAEDSVLISTDDVAYVVSVDTGQLVSTPTFEVTGPDVMSAALPDGSTVEWTYDRRLFDGEGRVVAPDGTTRFEFNGTPWLASRSDGSVPDVLVVQRDGAGGLLGLDAITGEQRWVYYAVQRYAPVIQVEGVAIGVVGETAIAIDITRGNRLWQTEIASTRGPAVATDGDVVIMPVRDGWETWLVGLRTRSGDEVWRIPVRSNVAELHPALDGTLLLLTSNRIIAYR